MQILVHPAALMNIAIVQEVHSTSIIVVTSVPAGVAVWMATTSGNRHLDASTVSSVYLVFFCHTFHI